MRALPLVLALLAYSAPVAAKDSLGVFSGWAAFRDPSVPRCYAIAKPEPSKLERDYEPYATVSTWPEKNIRGQFHLRLSRKVAETRSITLIINSRRFALTGGGGDAWAKDAAMDAAIVATMRGARRMIVSATDTRGRRFSNTYQLAGVATALDAATVGCARR
ncbi:hypothetical protein [Altererythrobacter sp.]|uniref:hypothetical protein n=1 Tax=Altererythrobacter sp. TaxID=1872480 RepID=UPI003D1225B1